MNLRYPEADTVHALSDYGENDDDADEYLTAISQSTEAFHSLTEHYKDIDRPVILLNTCCWFLPADWPGRDLPVPSRNYTNAVLRKTVNAFIVKKRWTRTGFVMLFCIWAYFP